MHCHLSHQGNLCAKCISLFSWKRSSMLFLSCAFRQKLRGSMSPRASLILRVRFRYSDSLARQENKDQLESEIRKADVICVVYSIDRMESFTRIPEFWLPYIRQLGKNVGFFYKFTTRCPLCLWGTRLI